jgi:prevent-host-death family protein
VAKVTSTQFIKTPGAYQDQAQREPVVIMKHNREHAVLLSAEEYRRLKRRDRQVVRVGEFAEEDIAAIAAAEAPPETASFNHELEGDDE